jgi:ribosomal protein S18 acetylase RimI-like enzyme
VCLLLTVVEWQLACVCASVDAKRADTVVVATLAVYVAERRRGIARQLIEHVQKNVPSETRRLLVHVQTGNDDAVAFYTKLGFVWQETVPDYYRKDVQPRSCEIYVKTLSLL